MGTILWRPNTVSIIENTLWRPNLGAVCLKNENTIIEMYLCKLQPCELDDSLIVSLVLVLLALLRHQCHLHLD